MVAGEERAVRTSKTAAGRVNAGDAGEGRASRRVAVAAVVAGAGASTSAASKIRARIKRQPLIVRWYQEEMHVLTSWLGLYWGWGAVLARTGEDDDGWVGWGPLVAVVLGFAYTGG